MYKHMYLHRIRIFRRPVRTSLFAAFFILILASLTACVGGAAGYLIEFGQQDGQWVSRARGFDGVILPLVAAPSCRAACIQQLGDSDICKTYAENSAGRCGKIMGNNK